MRAGTAAIAVGANGRRRTRALALANVAWFASVVLADVVALGIASFLSSGPASRVIIGASLINPVGAVRTGTLLAIEGTGAFGPASLALLRIVGGAVNAGVLVVASVATWTVACTAAAVLRLRRVDFL